MSTPPSLAAEAGGTIPTEVPPPGRIVGRSRRTRGSGFYLVMAVVAAASVVVGFFPTYFRPLAGGTFTASPLVHLHGILFFGWTALFVVQPLLVRGGRIETHRTIGYAGAALAAAMVVLGVTVGLAAAARGVAAGEGDAARSFLLITLTDMLLFGVLIGLAVAYRSKPQTHKRLMLLGTAALLPAAFGRLFGVLLGIEHPAAMHIGADSFLLAGVAHDLWTRGRVHRAYLWGGGFLVAVHALRLLTFDSSGWLWIAGRLLGGAGG